MRKYLPFLLLLFLPGRVLAQITPVGSPVTANHAGGQTLTLTYPTHLANDVAYVFCFGHSTETISGSKPYVTIATSTAFSGYQSFLLRRVLDTSEGPTETFTISVTNIYMCQMRVYRGVNPTTPEDPAAGNPQTGLSGGTFTASATLSGFTTTVAGDEALFFVDTPAVSTTMGTPTGWSVASVVSDATNGQAIGGWERAFPSVGAIGTTTSTLGTSSAWFDAMVAMQPVAGPTPTPTATPTATPTGTASPTATPTPGAGPSLVQQDTTPASGLSPQSLSLTNPTTVGNLLTVECAIRDQSSTSAPLPTISGLATTWTLDADSGTVNNARATLWHGIATATSGSVTLTYSSSTAQASCGLQEWNMPQAAVDQKSATGNNGTAISRTINTVYPVEIVIVSAARFNSDAPTIPAAPYVGLTGTSGLSPGYSPVYQITTAPLVNSTPSWSWSTPGIDNGVAMTTFYSLAQQGAEGNVEFYQ